MTLRNKAYSSGVFSSASPSQSYVVSIGNLSVGGSGKTPLTELLVKQLRALDQTSKTPLSIAILSRGYRSQCDRTGTQLLFQSPSKEQSGHGVPCVSVCGDEPHMLAKRLPGVWFGIGRDRLKSALELEKKGARLFILDDGFQHRRLKRQLDLVLLDAENPFANQQLLPCGPLREPQESLNRASAIFLYPVRDAMQFSRSCEQVRAYSQAPIVGMAPHVVGVQEVNSEDQEGSIPLSALKGQPIALFCGIARPERFVRTVESLGCLIVAQEFLADHAVPQFDQLMHFAKQSAKQGARYVICTEKDAVKCPQLPKLEIPLLFLRIELQVVEGKAQWDALLGSILTGEA